MRTQRSPQRNPMSLAAGLALSIAVLVLAGAPAAAATPAAAALPAAAASQQGEDPEVLLQAAMNREMVDGDLAAAIALYEDIVTRFSSDRTVAASALVRMGQCHEKLGAAEARVAYLRVVEDFGDQSAQVAFARERLALLSEATDGALSVTELRTSGAGRFVETWSLSADGTKMAVVDFETGQNIAVLDLPTQSLQEITRLTWEDGYTYAPRFSRDGSRLAFQVFVMEDGGRGRTELHVSDLAGNTQFLYRPEERGVWPIAWLGDGSGIIVRVSPAPGQMSLGLVSTADGSYRPLVPALESNPFWDMADSSPDGRFVVYADGPEGNADIYIVDVRSGARVVVSDHPANDAEPRWSPDGRHIVFRRGQESAEQSLWGIPVRDGSPDGHAFLIRSEESRLLNWTPAGLFTMSMHQIREVYVAPVDPATGSSAGKPELIDTGANGASPVWSPDGTHLALVLGVEGERLEVVVRELSSGRERRFPVPSSRVELMRMFDLRWLADGQRLGFSGWDDLGEPTLFRLTLASGDWETWPIDVEWWTRTEWSEDGNAFFFTRQPFEQTAPGIVRHDLTSGQEEYVYRTSAGGRQAILALQMSPDYRKLAFNEGGTPVNLDLETGTTWKAGTGGLGSCYRSPVAELLMCQARGDGNRNTAIKLPVVTVPGAEARASGIADHFSDETNFYSPVWSPDGSRVALVARTTHYAAYLMRNVIPEGRR